MLAERHDDEGREQRPERLAEIAADLKEALGEAVPPAGGGAGDARSLRVEDGAADADHRDRKRESADRIWRRRAAGRPTSVKAMPTGRIPFTGRRSSREADQRLQERGGDLEDEGDDADLEEAQRRLAAEHRIERRRQRLHRVVEHVRGAERGDDADRGCPGGPALAAAASA